ncbi:MAG: hypothetical protein JSS68_04690 [Actinobacteria bacterium]|nr:hypothetical protein [Actinomycetota bacterium]
MAGAEERKARRAVRAAQEQFEREQAKVHEARRKAFAEARDAGLSLRQIGEEVGLHHTRILQIIRGE